MRAQCQESIAATEFPGKIMFVHQAISHMPFTLENK
jgi:hypothetical protein